MAGSPMWKLYNAEGKYKASTNDIYLFAACIGVAGEGSTIRFGHSHIVWREGSEHQTAFESYDYCSTICHDRARYLNGNDGRSMERYDAALKAGLI